ncbi:MAG TPA: sulfatase-like hydrolase/transferase, partial [Myxococcota bacterium]|nr:sulfatase-like hydrolase/transferase [Myxococcota bacterium]
MFWMVACQPPETKPPVESTPVESPAADPVPLENFRPKTIILVNADTLRADRLPAYGGPRDTTPLLQARASGQVRASAWATSGWTPTSVPSLLTSQEIHGHGVVGVDGLEYQQVDGQMLQAWLGENGFQTAFFSSNHVLPSTSVVEGWGSYALVDDLWSSDKLVDATLSWLEQQDPEEPLFVMLQPMDNHHPWLPPDAYRGTFVDEDSLPFPIDRDADAQVEAVKAAYLAGSPEQRAALVEGLLAVYDEEILGLDASIERLLLGLEAQGRLQDSLLILTADHGESLYDAPDQLLHGGTLRQEVVGIPLLFYSPSIVSAD